MTLVSTIRLGLVGGSLIAFSAGWFLGTTWVMVLAGVIGAEELLETSIAASALKEKGYNATSAAARARARAPRLRDLRKRPSPGAA